ncbi:hypothetical protein [Micromonospora sp. RV43]|uniref:hypothetical protein n=1 Tax=Micromonospora sp. RV43 TaxID=1661387 RepID=UPI00128E2B14|nr:hypothetical protein [Micromonospora sp. RV43]
MRCDRGSKRYLWADLDNASCLDSDEAVFVEAVAPEDAGEHCHVVVVELLGVRALRALLDVGGDEELWWQFTAAECAGRSADVTKASL